MISAVQEQLIDATVARDAAILEDRWADAAEQSDLMADLWKEAGGSNEAAVAFRSTAAVFRAKASIS